ncbi:SOS response-associated peptidase [Sphingobacterium sp. SG20118]|uniref:SOS response-associated peptidase n=1 Tax=Sphingobacterium sp. SG20118 TaxID=3367156 RepID=UPI0037DFC48D
MCWDISLHTDIEIVKKTFSKLRDERKKVDYDYRYFENVQAITFPGYPIIYKDKESQDLGLVEMEWGVLPTYIQDPKEQDDRRRSMVNIRSERILADGKSYWHRLKDQRCLIPVSGTFEHRKVHGWKKKVPYYIKDKNREIFYIPGLYQWHESVDQDGRSQKVGSFGMLTREANTIMGHIHNDGPNKGRMPLFLSPELEQKWLSATDDENLTPIFNYEVPDLSLECYPVYTLRGFPNRPDGKLRYDPYPWSGLPLLGQDGPTQLSFF